jgi:hypothetical protein
LWLLVMPVGGVVLGLWIRLLELLLCRGRCFLPLWPFLDFAVVYFALPLCGAALTFFAAAKKVSKESGLTPVGYKWVALAFFGLSLISLWSIGVAPVRGGTHFLCRRKESKQRKRAHTASL